MANDGGVWVKVYPDAAGGGLEGLGGWADVTAVTGASGNRYTYTDIDGFDWVAYEWTDDGTVTTTDGLVDALIVGGGLNNGGQKGKGGGAIESVLGLNATTHQINVGLGGAERLENHSYLGALYVRPPYNWDVGAGGSAVSPQTPDGFLSSIKGGAAVEYAAGGTKSLTTPGSGGVVGQDGVVIVRVRASNALATIPNTWGDL